MKQILGAFRRTSYGTVAALFLLTVVGVALPAREASAASLLYRSLQLSSSQPSGGDTTGAGGIDSDPGEAANGDQVDHTYIFQVRTAGDLRAINIVYCDSAFGYTETGAAESCELGSSAGLPGFDAEDAPNASVSKLTGGDLDTPTWGTPATFAVDETATVVNNVLVEDATGLPGLVVGDYVRVVFNATETEHFANPSTLETFYAHIATYNSATTQDGTTDMDEGTVTSSTANTIAINTRVQETLKFSVAGFGGSTADGAPLAANDPTGACNAVDTTAAAIDEGKLSLGDSNQALAADTTYTTKSYFRLATNSARGAKVFYAGETLTSTAGDLIAPAATTSEAAVIGEEQFGFTLRATDGTTGVGDTVFEDYEDLDPVDDYEYINNGNEYAFDPASNGAPVMIAESTGVVGCDTVPVEYIANISNETPAGLYSTKISFVAAPSY